MFIIYVITYIYSFLGKCPHVLTFENEKNICDYIHTYIHSFWQMFARINVGKIKCDYIHTYIYSVCDA